MNQAVSCLFSRLAALIDDYLFGWVLASAAVGLLIPSLGVFTVFSTPILAVMIGSISLTLTTEQFQCYCAMSRSPSGHAPVEGTSR